MSKKILKLDGSHLEGGGQILRTAVSLSCITGMPVRINNIRKGRESPGLKPQHLTILKALGQLCAARIEGLKLASSDITFIPGEYAKKTFLKVDIGTSGSIGLVLQALLPVGFFASSGELKLDITGGTCGLGAPPVDYYPNVIFRLLYRQGIRASITIIKRGYYPKGGGEVSVLIKPIKHSCEIDLTSSGKVKRISGKSIANVALSQRSVAQRQADYAAKILKSKYADIPVDIKSEYVCTDSVGSEISIYAYTNKDTILASSAIGESKKAAETVGGEAADKLIEAIESGDTCDTHLVDNLIPYLALLGGSIKAHNLSSHAQTNIWVTEAFFGKIFQVSDDRICVKEGLWQS